MCAKPVAIGRILPIVATNIDVEALTQLLQRIIVETNESNWRIEHQRVHA
jgi:hypothetical protein